MAKTLVWVEHDNASVKDATLAAVTAASQLGEVHLLVAGHNCGAVASAAAQIAGVGKVHVADDAAYANALAENVAPLVAALMADHDAFLAPATTTGKNIAPRVAAQLDVMQISDILSVEGPKTFTRPIYAGNAIATVESSDAKLVITVRGTAFAKAAATGGSGSVEAVSGPGAAGTSTFISSEIAKSERDLRLVREYEEVAKSYNLPIPSDELGPVLMAIAEELPYEYGEVIHKALSAAGEIIFEEYGTEGAGSNNDVLTAVDAYIDENVSKSDISKAEAVEAVFDANPGAYDEYMATRYFG